MFSSLISISQISTHLLAKINCPTMKKLKKNTKYKAQKDNILKVRKRKEGQTLLQDLNIKIHTKNFSTV